MLQTKEQFVYVVSLVGTNVHNSHSIQYVIRTMRDLDKVRGIIKKYHNIEFEELSSRFFNGYWEFMNITDDRDITLVVERVDVL